MTYKPRPPIIEGKKSHTIYYVLPKCLSGCACHTISKHYLREIPYNSPCILLSINLLDEDKLMTDKEGLILVTGFVTEILRIAV
jgi:hypothetical protein